MKHLQFIKQTVLDRWGGSLNDLNETNYYELLETLSAKEPEGAKPVQSAFDFFSNGDQTD